MTKLITEAAFAARFIAREVYDIRGHTIGGGAFWGVVFALFSDYGLLACVALGYANSLLFAVLACTATYLIARAELSWRRRD